MTMMPEDEDRFASLEASNDLLTGHVKALTDAISIVNELQSEQQAMARRNEETRKMIEKRQAETEARIERNRVSSRLVGFAFAILLPVVSILVYATLLQHVNNLLEQQAKNRLTSCGIRNEGTLSNIRREQTLADLEQDPAVKHAHENSVAELKKSLVNCKTSQQAPEPTGS